MTNQTSHQPNAAIGVFHDDQNASFDQLDGWQLRRKP